MMTDARLESLAQETCLQRLRERTVGRIAFDVDGDPVILPVNYRLVDAPSGPILALRTRPGTVIEHAPASVAFEIDSVDPVHHQGWSVLVRGELLHATPTSAEFRARYDPDSWLTDRETWLLIVPWTISGRELHGSEPLWPFHPGDFL
jgi:uncharacterized protein